MTTYADIGLTAAINASGKMTALGGSVLAADVVAAMADAAGKHVVLSDLMASAGRHVARLLGAADAAVTSSASAAIAQTVAALIAGADTALLQRLPADVGRPREVILQKGHAVDWGAPATQMIALGGGLPVEVGSVNRTDPAHVAGAIGPETAALVYVQSHHTVHKGMLPFDEMLELGRTHGVPVIVDAAAEEDLRRWVASGADAVVFSGTKAIGGPTSGLVCGSAELMHAVRAQSAGIGRPMKVGKEEVLGLITALETFLAGSGGLDPDVQRTRMHEIVDHIARRPGIAAQIEQDDAGREIYRAVLTVGEESGTTATAVARELAASTPPMYVRDHKAAVGQLAIDPRPLSPEEQIQLMDRLDEILDAAGAQA
ncbi:DgaE family pyridoxal phosphate-dependent ammonia lyase [Georgenia deserti]|uniref:DgaE family pyridoxal phosphate-dependent ammonia lyase n=1 Tax=Georgenia deserti TaxID=2093781 RepID=A0ABW4L5E9_9MICO